DLPHDPVPVGDAGKIKAAILGGGGSHQGAFCGKFGFIGTEQAEQRTAQGVSVRVLFQSVDLAVNQVVVNGLALVGLDLHQRGVLTGILENDRVFLVGEDIVAVRGDFFQIVAAKGQVGHAGGG